MWDERYAEPGWAYGTDPNDFLREAEPSLPPASRVLCLAEGEGRNAVFLAGRGHVVTAVDQSAVGLRKAEGLARDHHVPLNTVVADLATWDLGQGAWDAIVSVWCHVPPAARARLHAAVVRALAPGGVFVLEAYTPDNVGRGTGGPQDASLCMTPEGLRAELAGLTFQRCEARVRDVREGKYHLGPSAVVQVIARKPAPPTGAARA
jgi:SAM-dependent methyltransferase